MSTIPCVLLMNDMHASKDTLSAFELSWMEALQICGEKGIEEIVVGGDLWQSRSSQTLSTLLLVQKCLLEATNRGILVTLAEGNHDLVDQESFEGYNHIFSPYKNVDVVDDHTVI